MSRREDAIAALDEEIRGLEEDLALIRTARGLLAKAHESSTRPGTNGAGKQAALRPTDKTATDASPKAEDARPVPAETGRAAVPSAAGDGSTIGHLTFAGEDLALEREAVIRVEYKTCPSCGSYKPRVAYARNATRVDGLQSQCRACGKKMQRASRAKADPEPAPKGLFAGVPPATNGRREVIAARASAAGDFPTRSLKEIDDA